MFLSFKLAIQIFRNINQYSIRIILVSSFKFGFVYTNFGSLLFWFLNTNTGN